METRAAEKHWPQKYELEKRYKYHPVTDVIGEGSCGRVYRAKDRKHGRTVALKIIPKVQFIK